MTFVAVTSAGAMGRSVREADAVSAYIWEQRCMRAPPSSPPRALWGYLEPSVFFRIFTSFGAKRETIVRINVMKGNL
jgi:hypothetical protein